MSNAYCTIAQFSMIYDARFMGALSNDANGRTTDTVKLQFLLDVQASELDSHLNGRYALPISPVPLVLTKYVAVKTAEAMFGRRNDAPKEVTDAVKWADEFIERLDSGVLSIPGVGRDVVPNLNSSEYVDGRSKFDGMPDFDGPASSVSTSKGQNGWPGPA